ncbi:MAG TPA: hypothetical protein VKF81_16465 [Blastocatellia bacterium]|nr:hypothetical protein [Blastocatellia bacterium]
MTPSVAELLETFDKLPERDRREAANEILRRVRRYDFAPLSDEELVLSAEELFLELDHREAIDGHS